MKNRNLAEVLQHIPVDAKFFNEDIIDLILNPILGIAPPNRITQTFITQCQALQYPEPYDNDKVEKQWESHWFKLLTLMTKYGDLARHQSSADYAAFSQGVNAASAKITLALGSWADTVGKRHSKQGLMLTVAKTAQLQPNKKYQKWLIRQSVLYGLLRLQQQLPNKPEFVQLRLDLVGLIDYLRNSRLLSQRQNSGGPVVAAAFYARLSQLLLDADILDVNDWGLVGSLTQIRERVASELFVAGEAHGEHQRLMINMRTQWMQQLRAVRLRWLWRMIAPKDQLALDKISNSLVNMGALNPPYYQSTDNALWDKRALWIKQVEQHALYLEDVWLPSLKNKLTKQLEQCVTELLLEKACKFSDLIRVLRVLPIKSRAESALLAHLAERFPEASVDEKLAMAEAMADRERKSGQLNFRLRGVLQQLIKQVSTPQEQGALRLLLSNRNAYIQSRLASWRGIFRQKEVAQLLDASTSTTQFIRAHSKNVRETDAQLQVKFQPYSETVSDDEYRQMVRKKLSPDSNGLTTLQKQKIDIFKRLKETYQASDHNELAIRHTLPQAVTATMSHDDLMAITSSDVLMSQSMHALEAALGDDASAIRTAFNSSDIDVLRELIQQFKDVAQVEEQKSAILKDDRLEMFQSTLERRLAGMWLTAHVLSTNNVAIYGSKTARWTSTCAKVGGSLVSMPVLSGILEATSMAIDTAEELRIGDNYARLRDIAPSGTSSEIVAEMIARMTTLRYVSQIHQLSLSGIELLAEFCFEKIKAVLLSQRGVNVAAVIDNPAVLSSKNAIENSQTFRFATAVADILTRPLGNDQTAADSMIVLQFYKRLPLKSDSFGRGKKWKPEALLLEPDRIFDGQVYRSPYSKESFTGANNRLSHTRLSRYGSRAVSAHEVVNCQLIGNDNGNSQFSDDLQRVVHDIKLTAVLAHRVALQTSDTVRQMGQNSQPQSSPLQPRQAQIAPAPSVTMQSSVAHMPTSEEMSRIIPPEVVRQVVQKVKPATLMAEIASMNQQEGHSSSSYEGVLEAMRSSPPQATTSTSSRVISTPVTGRPIAPAVVSTPVTSHTPTTATYTPFTPLSVLQNRYDASMVTAGPGATFAWPTEAQLKTDITKLMRKYAIYKRQDIGGADRLPHPDVVRVRSMLVQKMYEYSLLMTHYNVDQAVFLFNTWGGHQKAPPTPLGLFRQQIEAEARATAGLRGDKYNVVSSLPTAIPSSPL